MTRTSKTTAEAQALLHDAANQAEIEVGGELGAAFAKALTDHAATLPAEADPVDAMFRFGIVKDGRKWHVTENGVALPESFKTKAAAEAEADRCHLDWVAENARKADALLATPDYATMTKVERLGIAKAEVTAIREWVAGGKVGECPTSPCLDWMTDPANDKARKTFPTKTATSNRTPEQEAKMIEIITARRAAGESWYKVAEAISAEGIPTRRGGKWYDTTAHDEAKRLNLLDKVYAETTAA